MVVHELLKLPRLDVELLSVLEIYDGVVVAKVINSRTRKTMYCFWWGQIDDLGKPTEDYDGTRIFAVFKEYKKTKDYWYHRDQGEPVGWVTEDQLAEKRGQGGAV